MRKALFLAIIFLLIFVNCAKPRSMEVTSKSNDKAEVKTATVEQLKAQVSHLLEYAKMGDKKGLKSLFLDKGKGYWSASVIDYYLGKGRPEKVELKFKCAEVYNRIGFIMYSYPVANPSKNSSNEFWDGVVWAWDGKQWLVKCHPADYGNPDIKERERWIKYIDDNMEYKVKKDDFQRVRDLSNLFLGNIVNHNLDGNMKLISDYAYFREANTSWCNTWYKEHELQWFQNDRYKGMVRYNITTVKPAYTTPYNVYFNIDLDEYLAKTTMLSVFIDWQDSEGKKDGVYRIDWIHEYGTWKVWPSD